MVRIVKRRGWGSYCSQLGVSREFVKKECVCIDCTSMSKSKDFPVRELSPLYLGPVVCPDGLIAKTLENAWQYAKVYRELADGIGRPKPEYFEWRKEGFEAPVVERYPMGAGAVPLCSYWMVDGKYRKLDYIEARKQIYIPNYAREKGRLCFSGIQQNGDCI